MRKLRPSEVKQLAQCLIQLVVDYNFQKWSQQYFWPHMPFQNLVAIHQEAEPFFFSL